MRIFLCEELIQILVHDTVKAAVMLAASHDFSERQEKSGRVSGGKKRDVGGRFFLAERKGFPEELARQHVV